MAHIVGCLLDCSGQKSLIRSDIVFSSVPPGESTESVCKPPSFDDRSSAHLCIFQLVSTSPCSLDEKNPHVWRMAQQETRKYQLFPKDRQPAPPVIVRQLENEPPVPVPVAPTTQKLEKSSIASDLRQRIKEHNMNRRRKISVPELGPMTTVQEVPMDSRMYHDVLFVVTMTLT